MARSSIMNNESYSALSSARTFEFGGWDNYIPAGAPRLDVSMSDSQSLLGPRRPTTRPDSLELHFDGSSCQAHFTGCKALI